MTAHNAIDIALFPLSIFMLPGERRQLHIFEPRYRQLFAEVEKDKLQFGVPYSTGAVNRGLGSICKLVSVLERYEGGESDVLVECVGHFELRQIHSASEAKPYPYGKVALLKPEQEYVASQQVMDELGKLVEAMEQSGLPFSYPTQSEMLPIVSSLGFDDEQNFRFMSAKSDAQRQALLLNMIRYNRLLALQESKAEAGMYLN